MNQAGGAGGAPGRGARAAPVPTAGLGLWISACDLALSLSCRSPSLTLYICPSQTTREWLTSFQIPPFTSPHLELVQVKSKKTLSKFLMSHISNLRPINGKEEGNPSVLGHQWCREYQDPCIRVAARIKTVDKSNRASSEALKTSFPVSEFVAFLERTTAISC